MKSSFYQRGKGTYSVIGTKIEGGDFIYFYRNLTKAKALKNYEEMKKTLPYCMVVKVINAWDSILYKQYCEKRGYNK